jgi:CDP-diacylglycerol--serine O-phosphatidyltransferase
MKQLPNIFTLLNLFFGCVAIVLILQNGIVATADQNGESVLMLPEQMYWASVFIGVAAVIDFLDGLVARLLNHASEMGRQLDSLADVVSFGVAPAMIIYQFLRLCFARQEDGLNSSVLWLLPAFIIPCAGAYRLARFNLDMTQSYGFKGVPIPAAGLLVASFPLIYWFADSNVAMTILLNYWPMMALKFKGVSFKKDLPKLTLLVIAVVAGIFFKWLAVPLTFIVYVCLSLSMPSYARGQKNAG